MLLLPTLHSIHNILSLIFAGPWILVCGYTELPSPLAHWQPPAQGGIDNSPEGKYRSQTLRTAAEQDAHCLSKQRGGAR